MAKTKEKTRTQSEIEDLDNAFWQRCSDLVTRWDEDYDLWRLKEFTIDNWTSTITFNEPRAFANSVMQTVDSARLSIAVHRRDKDPQKESLMEKFAFAALANADENLANRVVNGTRRQSSIAWFTGIRGFASGRILVINDDGELRFEILPYDPKFLSYGTDGRGIAWSCYTTWRDPTTVAYEYPEYQPKVKKKDIKDTDTGIKVLEFWDDKENVVIADDQEVQRAKHKLGKPPTIVVPCGATPLVVGNEGKYGFIREWGDSFFAGARTLYPVQNEILSIWYSLVEKAHRPGFFIFDDALLGKKVSTPWGRGETQILSTNARTQLVDVPEIARSAPELFNIVSGAIQRVTFPYLKYGQVSGKEYPSGTGLSQLLQGPQSVLNPLLSAMSRFDKTAIKMIIEQYIKGGAEWFARGSDSKGHEFQETFTPEDMEGEFDVDVEYVSILPEQESANYAKAQLIKQSALADDKFIREKIIQFQDPKGIEDEMLVQNAELLSPTVKVLRIAKQLKDSGKEDEMHALLQDAGIEPKQTLMPEQPQGGAPMPPGQPSPQGIPVDEIAAKLQAAVGGE